VKRRAEAVGVTVTVNGEAREVTPEATVASLLEALDVRGDGTAVARNDEVVPRTRHAATPLREGDRLEIVIAVAGG